MSSTLTERDPGTLLLAILENVGLAVIIVDERERIAFANSKALAMWGGDHSAFQGASFREWRSAYRVQDVHGRDVPIEEALAFRTLAGEEVAPHDFRVILPDGSIRWMHSIHQRFSVFGIKGAMVIVSDETEAVMLRHTMEQFDQVELLGALTRGIIHDLNNMFAVLSENLHLALGDEGTSRATRARLQQMALALKKGTGLARKLGQFSRANELKIQSFAINEAVNTALELTHPLFGNKIHVKLGLAPNLPMLEGDPGEIEQALVNLVLNAVDAMPQGGEIRLSTELVNREVHGKSGETPRCSVLITVADTGVGIPEDIQSKIFEPFFTTKAERRGTGLGLSSVYGIVRHHQGEISVHSVPGHGTRFIISLPVPEAASPSHKGPDTAQAA